MTTPLVTASKDDGVTVLELRNPPANTYSYEMMRDPLLQVKRGAATMNSAASRGREADAVSDPLLRNVRRP